MPFIKSELDTLLKRYDTYMQTTRPVLDYYSKNPNFYEIAAKDIAYRVSMIAFAILNSYFCFCIYSFLGEIVNPITYLV